MIIAIYLVLAAAVVVCGAIIYVMADYEQNERRHGIERTCVHFRLGQCRLTRDYCSPCSLYKTEEERTKHKAK